MVPPNIILVIAVASGLAVVNLVLAVVWIACMRRSREEKRQLVATKHLDIEKRPSVLKRIRRPSHRDSDILPPPYRARPEIRLVNAVTPLTHFEEPDYLSRDRYTPPPKLHSKKRRSTVGGKGRNISPLVPSDDKRRLRNYPLPPAAAAPRRNPNNLTVPRGVMRAASRETFDTVSMCSTASAPIDMHEQILLAQPFSRALPYWPHYDTIAGQLVEMRKSTAEHATGIEHDPDNQCEMPAVPIATQPSITAHHLDFIDPLAPQPYESVLTGSRDGIELPETEEGTVLPRRPLPVSTPEAPSRMRSYFRQTSRYSAIPSPLRPSNLPKRSALALDSDSSRRVVLPSPHSP